MFVPHSSAFRALKIRLYVGSRTTQGECIKAAAVLLDKSPRTVRRYLHRAGWKYRKSERRWARPSFVYRGRAGGAPLFV